MKEGASVLILVLSVFFIRSVEAKEEDSEPKERTPVAEGPSDPPEDPSMGEAPENVGAIDAESRERLKARIEKALKKFDFEPSLSELQRAALKYQDADPQTARRWRTAPNRAALLPTLKFVVDHDLERDESLDRYQDEPDRWGADTDCDLGFQVSAQWELDELVFNSDEVRVWGALADRASRRESLLTMLVGYYFERRKLQVKELLSPPDNIEEMAELKLRIAELTASIDALTGGYLSAELKKQNMGGRRLSRP